MPKLKRRAPAKKAEFCARRGGKWIDETELHAFIASALRLQNVGVLLGAGASAGPLGGLLVRDLWAMFCDDYAESHEWLVNNDFLEDDITPNVEEFADTLEIARLEWTRSKNDELTHLEEAQKDFKRCVIRAALLQEEWLKKPELITEFPNQLTNHRRLLQRIVGARQPGQPSPWVFTTNYDLAIEWAAESLGLFVSNGFSGVHHRTFSPHNFDLGVANTLARGEARFGTYDVYLAKLHGSLTWRTDSLGHVRELPSNGISSALRNFIDGKSNSFGEQMVFPSAAKYLQTVGFVRGELFRRFTEFLARPQTLLLVSGFSFSDEHLNRLLSSALQNPTLSMVVYCPTFQRVADEAVLSDASKWLKKLSDLESPQVTLVGSRSRAYFSELASDLPEPAIYDEHSQEFLRRLREMELPENDHGIA